MAHWRLVTPRLARAVRRAGGELYVWTVDDARRIRALEAIGVAGVSKGSDTLKLAGEHGFLPMSLNLNPGYVASHWESVEEGARRTGRSPRRADWRLVREIFVAESDAEAWRLSVESMMGRMMR